MTDERYKEIIGRFNLPDSRPLFLALEYVEEIAQDCKGIPDVFVLDIIDACFRRYAPKNREAARKMAKEILE